MKSLLILIVVATTISASAADRSGARRRDSKVSKPDTLASAVDFARAFYSELNREVTLPNPFNIGGGGDSGNLHHRAWTYKIPASAFPPERLSEVAYRALKRWDVGWAGARGDSGGFGKHHFSAYAAATGASIFIDAIAYTEGEDTVILLLIRCAG